MEVKRKAHFQVVTPIPQLWRICDPGVATTYLVSVMDDEQRMKELRRRRVKGARLLASGVQPAEVAHRVGVSRQSVMRWERDIEGGGIERVARLGSRGPPSPPDFKVITDARPDQPLLYSWGIGIIGS
jgi:DNA-binding XRE family transcriptional regulator